MIEDGAPSHPRTRACVCVLVLTAAAPAVAQQRTAAGRIKVASGTAFIFLYAPAAGQLGFVLKIVRGIAAYVSGRIAKLASGIHRLETPTAIVGVRGTRLAVRVGP